MLVTQYGKISVSSRNRQRRKGDVTSNESARGCINWTYSKEQAAPCTTLDKISTFEAFIASSCCGGWYLWARDAMSPELQTMRPKANHENGCKSTADNTRLFSGEATGTRPTKTSPNVLCATKPCHAHLTSSQSSRKASARSERLNESLFCSGEAWLAVMRSQSELEAFEGAENGWVIDYIIIFDYHWLYQDIILTRWTEHPNFLPFDRFVDPQ